MRPLVILLTLLSTSAGALEVADLPIYRIEVYLNGQREAYSELTTLAKCEAALPKLRQTTHEAFELRCTVDKAFQ